jgi:integrase
MQHEYIPAFTMPARHQIEGGIDMPAYYDEKTRSWYCKFYYTDYTGTKKQKKKRGFKLQREAKEWERSFLEKQQADITMSFEAFAEIYLEDMSHRIREHTLAIKRSVISSKLIPYFGKLPMNEITPATVRKWQNEMIAYRDAGGNAYSAIYLRTIHGHLSAVFNYAVKYYGLRENPCQKAGTMGTMKPKGINFWTKAEFDLFIQAVDKPQARAGFLTLYYTGMRIGELLALTLQDIDFEGHTITITKSYQRLKGKDIITPPKTPKSNRTVTVPEFLCEELRTYTGMLYKLQANDRLFPCSKIFFERELKRGAAASGVKQIRVHDIRHSHASLLVELGCSPLLIAERLGHENVQTTLNVYSHLYPNKQDEIAEKLNNLK